MFTLKNITLKKTVSKVSTTTTTTTIKLKTKASEASISVTNSTGETLQTTTEPTTFWTTTSVAKPVQKLGSCTLKSSNWCRVTWCKSFDIVKNVLVGDKQYCFVKLGLMSYDKGMNACKAMDATYPRPTNNTEATILVKTFKITLGLVRSKDVSRFY